MGKSSKNREMRLSPRLRVMVGRDIAFGPGKAELLALIAETGSIREAALRMDMSYMRAWTLVKTMNGCFTEPLIEAVRGGQSRGGAQLTSTGQQVLKLYRQMDANALKAARPGWQQFQKLLRS